MAVVSLQPVEQVGRGDEADRNARRVREILNRRSRQPAAPEERGNFAVLERADRFGAPKRCRVMSLAGSMPAAAARAAR